MFWRESARAIVVAIAVTATGISYAADSKDGGDKLIVEKGFEISPIPKSQLNFAAASKDPDLVGLGSYLVNGVADCGGCHSFPRYLTLNQAGGSNPSAGDPYQDNAPNQSLGDGPLQANFNTAHFLAGGRCFGPIMSRNITPDSSGRPLGLNEEEFFKVMRTGEDIACEKNPGDPICTLFEPPGTPQKRLQTMSWPTFHNMTDRDIRAIYAYLSALPPKTACNTAADGCPGFSGTAKGNPANNFGYTYVNTDGTCPNPPPPQ